MSQDRRNPHPRLSAIADLGASVELSAKLLGDRSAEFIDQYPKCYSRESDTKVPFSSIVESSGREWEEAFGGSPDDALRNFYFGCVPDRSLPVLAWTEDETIPGEIIDQLRDTTVAEALFVQYHGAEYFVAFTNWSSTDPSDYIPHDHDVLFLSLIPADGIDFDR